MGLHPPEAVFSPRSSPRPSPLLQRTVLGPRTVKRRDQGFLKCQLSGLLTARLMREDTCFGRTFRSGMSGRLEGRGIFVVKPRSGLQK